MPLPLPLIPGLQSTSESIATKPGPSLNIRPAQGWSVAVVSQTQK